MRISDWSSDVCSSDLLEHHGDAVHAQAAQRRRIAGGDVDQAGLVAHQDLAAGHLVEAVDGAQQGRLAGAGEPHEDADLALLDRSEEHTSELQSLMRISYAVFCLKKKIKY